MKTFLLPQLLNKFVRFARWDAWASQRRLVLQLQKAKFQRASAKVLICSRITSLSAVSCGLVKLRLTHLSLPCKSTRFHFRCSATSTSRRVYVRFGLTRHYLRTLLDWGLVFRGFRRPGSSFHS